MVKKIYTTNMYDITQNLYKKIRNGNKESHGLPMIMF